MKNKITLFAILFFVPTLSFAAPVKPWGLGVILHNPTGVSLKHRFSKDNSLDAALGYSFGYTDNITLHSTYLWEFNESLKINDHVSLGHYFGVGGALHSRDRNEDPPPWADRDERDDEFGLAVRGVAVMNYYFDDPTFEVFAEVALNFFIVPGTDADLDIAVGGRYFF
jgi:hypothetical protein